MSEVWKRLSEEQKTELEKEHNALISWEREQRRIREQELRDKGEWIEFGLDANQEKFADIIEERKRRFFALQRKYGFR